MKDLIIILLLLFSVSQVHSQNWQLLPKDTLFLKDAKGRVATIQVKERHAFTEGELILLAPGAGIHPGDLPTRIFQLLSERKDVLPLYNPTLIGAHIRTMDNGDTYLRDTMTEDSILVKTRAGLHDTWQFNTNKTTQAEVTLLRYDTLFGIADSFKEITVNSNDIVLKITLSKTQGIVATHNLFPQSRDSIYAYRRTADPRLTYRQINDFEVGDIFHSQFQQEILYSGKIIDTVVGKKVSPDSLTVTYSIKRLNETENSSPHRFTLTHSTKEVTLSYSEAPVYDELPGILYLPDEFSSIWYYVCYDSSESFPEPYMRSFVDMFGNFSTSTSYTGAGRYSYRSLESEPGNVYSKLVYYKKASREWGKKVVISTPPSLHRSTLQLYPNPVSNFLMVQGLEANQPASIYNALGQIEMTLRLTNSALDLSSLSAGAYYLRLENGQTYHFIKAEN